MKNYCFSCMEELGEDSFCPFCNKTSASDHIYHHLKPGTILNNNYLVGNCLGEGGFGITYIGRDLVLDTKVAIKEYYPNGYVNRNNMIGPNVVITGSTHQDFFNKGKERFLQEARSLAKFRGESGIVSVWGYFEANNTAYIIMEYLDGVNLSTYLKQRGVFSPNNIFELMIPIVYSLQKVHETGIIHRDISPDNIMFLKNGSLKLMDFGSARVFTNDEKEMSVIFKQGYAPEEQYRKTGEQGPWTDVYGLCATMYRCITGRAPENALDRMIKDEIRPPSELGIRITKQHEYVLMFGLEVYHENRCHNMMQLYNLILEAINNSNEISIEDSVLDENKTCYADDDLSYSENIYDDSKDVDDNIETNHQKSRRTKRVSLIIVSLVLISAIIGVIFFIITKNSVMTIDKANEAYWNALKDEEDDIEKFEKENNVNGVSIYDFYGTDIPDVLYLTNEVVDDEYIPYLHFLTADNKEVIKDRSSFFNYQVGKKETLFTIDSDDSIYILHNNGIRRIVYFYDDSEKRNARKEAFATYTYDEKTDGHHYMIRDDNGENKYVNEDEYNEFISSILNKKVNIIISVLSNEELEGIFPNIEKNISVNCKDALADLKSTEQ